MILPTGAIHLLDRLKFRFKEDYRIDERLLDAFLRVETTNDAVFSVLSHLKETLDAKHAMVWTKTPQNYYELLVSTNQELFPRSKLPEAMKNPFPNHWIRHEPLSKDWILTQESLFGRVDERVTAIDVLYDPLFCLVVAWSETIPTEDSLESDLSLIRASFELDHVPIPLRRSVRTPYGKTYLLAPILALYRFHDPETMMHQEEATSIADGLLQENPALAEQIKTLLWIKNVGAILTPKCILHKPKRSKEEMELCEETKEGSKDLLALFHVEEHLLLFSSLDYDEAQTLLPEDVAFAEAAWRLTDHKTTGFRPRLPHSLIKRFPQAVREKIKHHSKA